MLKLFPHNKCEPKVGCRLWGELGWRSWDCESWLAGWLIDRQGDSHRHHRRLWFHSIPVFWAVATSSSSPPHRPRLLSINVRKWLPLWLCASFPPPTINLIHRSNVNWLTACLTVTACFRFRLKLWQIVLRVLPAIHCLIVVVVVVAKCFIWNDFCNCCQCPNIINRLINDRLIVRFIEENFRKFFAFFEAELLVLIYWKTFYVCLLKKNLRDA